MAGFSCISAQQTQQMIADDQCQLVDIRDEQSFRLGHIPGAQHLGNHNLAEFIGAADKQRAVVVCCYHGVSSQSAASYLAEQGFSEVFSMDGGFEYWRQSFPDQFEQS